MRGLIFLFTLSVVAANEGSVDFWGSKFTLICPGDHYFNNTFLREYESTYSEIVKDEEYFCARSESAEEKYYFYIQATVCDNCYDLDSAFVAGAIGIDLLFTGGIMIIIYLCTQKKTSGEVPSKPVPAKATSRSAGRAPPVPATDYEALNPQTRSKDIYAGVQRNG